MDDNEQYTLGYDIGWNMGANGEDWYTTGLDISNEDFLKGLKHGYDDGYEIYLEEDYELECFLDEDSEGNTLQ